MKKFMVSVVVVVCGVASGFSDNAAGLKEALGVRTNKSLSVSGKVEAFKDIAKRYPGIGATVAGFTAWEYFRGNDFAAAFAEADAGIAGFPANTNAVVSMIGCKACVLQQQKKCAEAIALLDASIRDYPTMDPATKASFKRRQADMLSANLNDPVGAAALYREAVEMLDPGDYSFTASLSLARNLKKAGAGSEVTGVFQAAVLKNVAAVGCTEAMERAFNQVDPAVLGVEKYREFLNGVLLRVPAVEANAKFLGRVKSELEKFK